MKKILLVMLLFLSGCSIKNKLFTLNIDNREIIVGVLNETIDESIYEEIAFETNKKDEKILSDIKLFLSEVSDISLNGYSLKDRDLKEACAYFNGKYEENACLISKAVKNKNNYVILRSDVLSDNNNIDNLEVHYR